jgi:hypothetical protein
MTEEELLLEQRKVKALEKIANAVDSLTIWFEEIEKDEWSNRIQYYMSEYLKSINAINQPKEETEETEESEK